MVTLLKAYLIGTNDPFQLTNILIDELKKDLQAYSQKKIAAEYDIEEWNEEKTDILEAIEEWEEAIADTKDMIQGRTSRVNTLKIERTKEENKDEPDQKAIEKLNEIIQNRETENVEYDRIDRNTIRRYQRKMRGLKTEISFYDKWYKEEVGFAEEDFENEPIMTQLEVLNESLDILNDLIIEEEKEEIDDVSSAKMKEELADAKIDIDAIPLIDDEMKQKLKAQKTTIIRRKFKQNAKFNAKAFQNKRRLEKRYNDTLEAITILEKQADKEGLELSDTLQDKKKKRADDKKLKDSLKEKPKSKWEKELSESRARKEKQLPINHEKKKIWLEGGFPSWAWISKDMEGPKRVKGFNEKLQERAKDPKSNYDGPKQIPIDAWVESQYKDSTISLKEFQQNIKEKYPKLIGAAKASKDSGTVSGGSWLEWEIWGQQFSHVLKKPKVDPYGDELLVRLQQFMRGLNEEELKHFDEPVVVQGETRHGLVNRAGKMGPKKARVANLKGLYNLFITALDELELDSTLITHARYIIERTEWALEKSKTKLPKEEEEEDLTEQHQIMIELFHDAYDMALDIQEEFPEDKEKTYEYDLIKEALEEVKLLMQKIDSDEKPEKEELLDLMVQFEVLSRKADDLEIPNWGPAKPKIEEAIDKLEKKLDKFYGKLSNKDLKEFKEMLKKEGIKGEPKQGRAPPKPRNFNYSTERKKLIRAFVTGVTKIRDTLFKKYIDEQEGLATSQYRRYWVWELLNSYFPRYRNSDNQQKLDTQRGQLLTRVYNGDKVSLTDYPLLYARGTTMEKKGKWNEEKEKVESTGTTIYNKKPVKFSEVNYRRWKERGDEAEDEADEFVQQVAQDKDKILDDDEMEDYEEIVGVEGDIDVQSEKVRERVKGKLGENADEGAIDREIARRKEKAELAREKKEKEGQKVTDKALVDRMNALLDSGEESLKEGENFEQFIKRMLKKEKEEKRKKTRQISLPKERTIDRERREAAGVGEEEAIDDLQDLISQPFTHKPESDSE